MDKPKSNNNIMDGVGSNVKKVIENSKTERYGDIMLRALAFILTFISAVVVGVDKETQMVSFTLVKTLPPLHVPVTAKWQYMSAFMYLLVSDVIACAYAGVSWAYCMAKPKLNNRLELVMTLVDLTMTGLLFSATGAAMAIGVLGMNGNSHVQWHKVCNVFGDFCRQFEAGLVLSLLGSFAFLLLVVLAVFNLYKRSR
ncbi:CASP-like protein 1E2 [Pistacia vera]|uniref:CASP-like protein 1E2 n=1 Tax=Pistacia vera TaxID=55513 RepID=UPI00126346A1|nr:CASP-like protein 1E2 [Pistacia vera]